MFNFLSRKNKSRSLFLTCSKPAKVQSWANSNTGPSEKSGTPRCASLHQTCPKLAQPCSLNLIFPRKFSTNISNATWCYLGIHRTNSRFHNAATEVRWNVPTVSSPFSPSNFVLLSWKLVRSHYISGVPGRTKNLADTTKAWNNGDASSGWRCSLCRALGSSHVVTKKVEQQNISCTAPPFLPLRVWVGPPWHKKINARDKKVWPGLVLLPSCHPYLKLSMCWWVGMKNQSPGLSSQQVIDQEVLLMLPNLSSQQERTEIRQAWFAEAIT